MLDTRATARTPLTPASSTPGGTPRSGGRRSKAYRGSLSAYVGDNPDCEDVAESILPTSPSPSGPSACAPASVRPPRSRHRRVARTQRVTQDARRVGRCPDSA